MGNAVAALAAMFCHHATADDLPKVVVLGDSLTAGYGVRSTEAYPALLQREIDSAGLVARVVNAGVSGDTTADGLRRVDAAVDARTTILVVALGANDGLLRRPVSDVAENLESIVDRARARSPSIRIVIAGVRMPPQIGAEYARAFNATFAAVASRTDAVLLPDLLDEVGGIAALNQDDGIHPTADGQRRIAKTVWSALRPVLAEKSPDQRPR